jgi:hypothetical protein
MDYQVNKTAEIQTGIFNTKQEGPINSCFAILPEKEHEIKGAS